MPGIWKPDERSSQHRLRGSQQSLGRIAGSGSGCEYKLPTVEQVQNIVGADVSPDYESFSLEYHPSGRVPATTLTASTDGCATGHYQYDSTSRTVTLCEGTCATVQSDSLAKLKANFGCLDAH